MLCCCLLIKGHFFPQSRVVALENQGYELEENGFDLDVKVEESFSETGIIVEISTGPKGK